MTSVQNIRFSAHFPKGLMIGRPRHDEIMRGSGMVFGNEVGHVAKIQDFYFRSERLRHSKEVERFGHGLLLTGGQRNLKLAPKTEQNPVHNSSACASIHSICARPFLPSQLAIGAGVKFFGGAPLSEFVAVRTLPN